MNPQHARDRVNIEPESFGRDLRLSLLDVVIVDGSRHKQLAAMDDYKRKRPRFYLASSLLSLSIPFIRADHSRALLLLLS